MPLSMSLRSCRSDAKLLDQADVVEKAIKEFENLGVRSELSVRLAFSGACLAECLHLFATHAMKRLSNVLEGPDSVPVKDVAALAVPGANRPAVAGDSSAYAVLNADRSKLLYQLPGTKNVAVLVTRR